MAQFLPMNISAGASWLKSRDKSLAPGKLRGKERRVSTEGLGAMLQC
jgi:hypothetical protein